MSSAKGNYYFKLAYRSKTKKYTYRLDMPIEDFMVDVYMKISRDFNNTNFEIIKSGQSTRLAEEAPPVNIVADSIYGLDTVGDVFGKCESFYVRVVPNYTVQRPV